MAWKINISDKSMLLDDFSPDDLVTACVNHEGVNWLRLYVSPGIDPGALYDLISLAAKRLEVPGPDRPKNAKEAIGLLAHLEQVDDDLPTAFAEGGIPLEGTDDQETTT